MNRFQLNIELIDGSIKKWKGIVFRNRINRGPLDCPLCLEYNQVRIFYGSDEYQEYIICNRCPIKIYTHTDFCENTPYFGYQCALGYKNEKGTLSYANKELIFLYELRRWYLLTYNKEKNND